MVKITIQGVGPNEFSRKLGVNIAQMRNLAPFHSEAIEVLSERSDDIFKKDGKNLRNSPKWKPLKPATKIQKASKWGTAKPLQNSGTMKNTRKKKANKQKGELTFTTPYAKYHAFGTKTIPQRNFVDVDELSVQKIQKELQKHIQKSGGAMGRIY